MPRRGGATLGTAFSACVRRMLALPPVHLQRMAQWVSHMASSSDANADTACCDREWQECGDSRVLISYAGRKGLQGYHESPQHQDHVGNLSAISAPPPMYHYVLIQFLTVSLASMERIDSNQPSENGPGSFILWVLATRKSLHRCLQRITCCSCCCLSHRELGYCIIFDSKGGGEGEGKWCICM